MAARVGPGFRFTQSGLRLLKCNVSSHAAKLKERRCRMDCRVESGNDERKCSNDACARKPSGLRAAAASPQPRASHLFNLLLRVRIDSLYVWWQAEILGYR
jgi:hypothetical protein